MSNYLVRDLWYLWRWVKSLWPGGETPAIAKAVWLFDRAKRGR